MFLSRGGYDTGSSSHGFAIARGAGAAAEFREATLLGRAVDAHGTGTARGTSAATGRESEFTTFSDDKSGMMGRIGTAFVQLDA